jgi:phosphate transport system permease protein
VAGHLPGLVPAVHAARSGTGRTILTTSLVLAVMILPIITALCREVFLQTPKLHEEAALALGATRWEMIRMAVCPFARAGIVSAVMLGLGRALGETMAVAMVLSGAGVIKFAHRPAEPQHHRREHRAELPRGLGPAASTSSSPAASSCS